MERGGDKEPLTSKEDGSNEREALASTSPDKWDREEREWYGCEGPGDNLVRGRSPCDDDMDPP